MFGDLHIHMILDGVYYRAAIDAQKEHPLDGLVRARLSDYQARGVCLLRDGGDAWGVSLRARELAGEYGIDYRSPAFPIYRRGHYGAFIGRGFDTEDEYRALLDEAGEKRADFIKLMISGLIDFDHFGVLTEPGPEPQDIRRMIELAHAAGFAVMAHANGDRAVTAALQAGVDSIEHGAYLSESVLLRMAQQRTLWVPTLSTIGNLIGSGRYPDAVLRRLLAQQQEAVRFVAAHGGRIGLGSDAGAWHVMHGQAIPDELGYLTAALSGSFAPTYRFENLEILRSRWRLCRLTDAACPLRVHKVFLQFSNLNLEQNPSLTALAI